MVESKNLRLKKNEKCERFMSKNALLKVHDLGSVCVAKVGDQS